MDGHRFDTLTRQLLVLRSRRAGLQALLAGAGAMAFGLVTPDGASACKGKGSPCTADHQCCFELCKGKKKVKNKKKKVGKCSCSPTRGRCRASSDCCRADSACGFNACEDHPACCVALGFQCFGDCDCCGDNVCGDAGVCEQEFCGETQEECFSTDECCFDEDECASNGCVAGTVCCGDLGAECDEAEEGCDCCDPYDCGAVAVDCAAEGTVCCAPATVACANDCDCCRPLKCLQGTCADPVCPPRRQRGGRVEGKGAGPTPCPPGDPVLCCQEGDTCCTLGPSPTCCPADTDCTAQGCAAGCTVECPPGQFEPCCPQGSACTQPGCQTDTPRVCPTGAGATARPLVFCGPPEAPLSCGCADSICVLACSTTRPCTSDAECRDDPGGAPDDICIRCPASTGDDRTVCAAPCPRPV